MTGAQLSGIAGDVSEMSKEQMEIFMEKVAGPAFEESVEAFGLVQDWADDKAPIVLAKAKEAWGATNEWGAEQFDKVNTLASKIPVEEIQALSEEILATTGAVAEMTGQQVSALAGKAHEMSKDHFEAFVDKVADPAFDASVEAFGQAKSWSAKKVPILTAKVEQVWGPAKDWSGEKINKMGSFAHSAVTDHIPELAGEAFSGAAELLGQHADWTGEQLSELGAKAKEAWGPVENWGGEQINKLGSIAHEALHDDLPKLSAAAFDASVEKLGEVAVWTKSEGGILKGKAVAAWGPVSEWSGDQMNKMGTLLVTAVEEDIPNISAAAFGVAGELLGQADDWTDDQMTALVAKSKEVYGDLDAWSEETLEKMGSIAHEVIVDDIPRMSNKMFEEAIVKFGKVKNYDYEEKLQFKEKAKAVWGPVSDWSGQKMNRMGELLGTAVREDIPQISAAAFRGSVKTLANFGEWSGQELGGLKNKAVESWGPVKDWSVNNVRDLGGMTKGMLEDDLPRLSKEAFKASLAQLKDTKDWSAENLRSAGEKAKETYGGVEGWSKDAVEDLGGLVAGLKSIEIPKLTVEASVSVEPAAVENMNSEQTAAFSSAQVAAMPSDSKKRFTGDKLKTMNSEAKRAAVCDGGPWCPAEVTDIRVKRSSGETEQDVLNTVAEATDVEGNHLQVLYTDTSSASSAALRRALLSGEFDDVVVIRYGSDGGSTDEVDKFTSDLGTHPWVNLDGEPVTVRVRTEQQGRPAEGAPEGPHQSTEEEWEGSGLATREEKASGDASVGGKDVLGDRANLPTIGIIAGSVVAVILIAVVVKTTLRRRSLAQGGRYNKYAPREEGAFSEMMQAQAPRNSMYNPMTTP